MIRIKTKCGICFFRTEEFKAAFDTVPIVAGVPRCEIILHGDRFSIEGVTASEIYEVMKHE